MDEHRPLRTYGRIKARTLKPRQAGLMETLLPHLAVPEAGAIDVEALFSPSFRGEEAGGGARFPPPFTGEGDRCEATVEGALR